MLDFFGATDRRSPYSQAALVGQALTRGLAQSASVGLVGALDTHFGLVGHGPRLYDGLAALERLIAFLKQTDHPEGGSFFDYTTLVAFSEFARTPTLNDAGGRDHHAISSCLLAGAGIRGGTVVGASSDVGMGVVPIDPATGAPDPEGLVIRPPDLHATIFTAMGLDHGHLSNLDPVVIEACLARS